MDYICKSVKEKSSRLTIGFLEEMSNEEFQAQLMMGIMEAAKKYDVNIIRFGSFLGLSQYSPFKQTAIKLDHIEQYELDGLMFMGWTKSGPLFNYDDFMARFGSIPLLSIGSEYKNIPYLYFPGHIYVRELLLHLINTHGCRNIAYIEPLTPDERNETYINTMKENGIFNPLLYVSEKDLTCNNLTDRGKKALSILLDERRVKFDAILLTNINETEALVNEAKSREIDIQKDFIVTSCEDGDFGRYSSPGITSIQFPWMELGFLSCEKMVKLVTKGIVPLSTIVPGKIFYRGSCGCVPESIRAISDFCFRSRGKALKEISKADRKAITDELEENFPYKNIDFDKLLDAFISDYLKRSNEMFLKELINQVQNTAYYGGYSDVNEIVSVFRKILTPYLMKEKDALLWSGDIFQQSQVLLREKTARMIVYEKANEKIIYQTLQEISRLLVTKFNRKELYEILHSSLQKLNIRSCHIFLFNENAGTGNLFDNCIPEFGYSVNTPFRDEACMPSKARGYLKRIFDGKDTRFTTFAHILQAGNENIGFILFEPGPMGQRVYQILSICISTALSGSKLLEKLDFTYKKLIEQAQREGMAEIATDIIHNIGNILNSVSASVYMLRDLAESSSFSDLSQANSLLVDNIDNLEDFIGSNPKAKRLMEFYTRLSIPFSEFLQQMHYHINRSGKKVNMINEIIISQQNYAGVNTTLERLDLTNVLEDVIKLLSASIEKYHIDVQRDYRASPRVLFQRIKLFHILVNLINNAIEAMEDNTSGIRVLRFSIFTDTEGSYVYITDNGCGIPENLRDKIFVSGFSTKKGFQGIGLSSCLSYMLEEGGSIWAESDGPGRGATLALRFKKIPL